MDKATMVFEKLAISPEKLLQAARKAAQPGTYEANKRAAELAAKAVKKLQRAVK